MSESWSRGLQTRALLAIILAVALVASYRLLEPTGWLPLGLDGPALREWLIGLGSWGPLGVIGLMTLAIVLSPVPSAPIALAAGLAYGHGWGAVYVLIGAEAGAVIAFALARVLGYDILRRWFGDRLQVGLLGSQNTLMAVVFVSRLLPFVSFDLVSYAAGLTSLSFWRFAVATLAGIVPASFALAHFGSELASSDTSRVFIAVLVIGAITLIPFAYKFARGRRRSRG